MSGIAIPSDRTTKQPVRAYCYNPECKPVDGDRFEFGVSNDRFACPKCGAFLPPMVGVLSLVHLLVRDPKGPIIGEGGLRWRLACEERRAYLATVTNNEAATVVREVANCPGCLLKTEHGGLK
jgi:hypothetical protein